MSQASDSEIQTFSDVNVTKQRGVARGSKLSDIVGLAPDYEEDPAILGLRRRLRRIIEDFEEIFNVGVEATSDCSQIPLFNAMVKTTPKLYERFTTLYEELCDMNGVDEPSIEDRNLRSQAKSLYFKSCSMAETFQTSRSSTSPLSSTTMQQTMGTSRPRAKLPTISLPPFDGQRTKWQRFRDTFESLVINDPDLTPIDRFHYLVASLQGPASAVIAQLPLSEANFPIAWKALVSAYDNPRLLATAYIDQLVAMKPFSSKPTLEQLKLITCQFAEWVAAFKQIPITDRADFLLFYLARRVLDNQTRESFELQQDQTKFPRFDDLINFLRQRCTASELAMGMSVPTMATESKSSSPRQFSKPNINYMARNKTSLFVSPSSSGTTPPVYTSNVHLRANPAQNSPSTSATPLASCPACKGTHNLCKCIRFSNMSVDERQACLTNWSGCRNCLFSSHPTKKCVSRGRCRFCNARHHSLLHINDNTTPASNNIPSHSKRSPPSLKNSHDVHPSTMTLSVNTKREVKILLGTALCSILDLQGRRHTIRIVLDSGSQFSFLSRNIAKELGLSVKSCNIEILGIGQTPFSGLKGKTFCRLMSNQEMLEVSTEALVVDTITSELPSSLITESARAPYLDYQLADPLFWDPRPIDFLLGSDLFADILTGEIITLKKGEPKLIGTIFGFVVMGRSSDINEARSASALCATTSKCSSQDSSLSDDLRHLWELEELPTVKAENPDDIACETFFNNSHYRLPTGRYVVRLPFKDERPQFPSTRWSAIKRLSHVESKLARNIDLCKHYGDFMAEYEELGHMTRATTLGQYLIPHHGVTKGSGDNLKVRVVFDASASTSMGSLNDYLHIGPKLQNNIVDILLHFRRHEICFTVDLVKMYRQILIHPQDRTYQHILWRDDPSKPIQEYELATVTYGLSCAPYLALRTIRQLLEDEGAQYPLAASAIRPHMYVDDLATGADTLDQALELQRQVVALMAKGQFPLSKWASNHPELMKAVGYYEDDSKTPRKIENPEDRTRLKILGLQWDPTLDAFSYDVVKPDPTCTKRAILAAVSRIYDPLGFLGPIVIQTKGLIQSAWKINADWDSVLPETLQNRWKTFIDNLAEIVKIGIPRWICPAKATSYELLIFGDASELAYCASAYLRASNENGTQVNLLLAKTKLAPLKKLTIPRLELCAAVLASSLLEQLSNFIEQLPQAPNIYLFSDSEVVLGWLNTPTFQLQTFVANRVTRILHLTRASQWHHVKSEENPSDLGSRGVEVSELINKTLWFHGPDWAKSDPSLWSIKPSSRHGKSSDDLPELKRICLAVTVEESYIFRWSLEVSNYMTLLRTVSWFLRFIHNSTRRSERHEGALKFQEIKKALSCLCKIVQSHSFYPGQTASFSCLPKTLRALRPFFDEDGVLRVGGRLKHFNLPFYIRHPILLPGNCHFTSLIISHYHKLFLHPGPTLLHSMIRRQFWIIGGRGKIKQFTRDCIQCRRLNASPCQPLMADLPAERLAEGRAFLNVGVDFAGPFLIKESLRKKASLGKCYLCLFICLSSRAIHLEAVSSLSTPAFLAAFDRFISRRGLPRLILSDNGTNFVGAAHHLSEVYHWQRQRDTQSAIEDYATLHELEWRFIPPHAPHFGGSWEAGVRSAKRLLRSIYGDGAFTYEELSTLFARVEAILNSRPICPLSSDPDDLDVLTPGHLLIGGPLLAPPEVNLMQIKEGRLGRWQHVQQKTQCFWKRWKGECLQELQVRSKWRIPQRNIKVNDLVLIKGEDTDRKKWPLGRVEEVFPGKDGTVRVASVTTSKGLFKRPATKLVLLLPSDEQDSEKP